MAEYSRELIINAFLHRFKVGGLSASQLNDLKNLGETHYDKVGKDTFRIHGSVTPETIKQYQQFIKSGEKYANE
jgi:hypothetical protein